MFPFYPEVSLHILCQTEVSIIINPPKQQNN